MKKAYLFIGLFALWCLVSALWYMFWVKGLSPDPENINPHESALAIAEILLMALISLLLGFAIAWHLRADSIAIKQEQLDHIRIETKSIETDIQTAREQLRKAEHTLARARETFREDFFAATREKERLQAELENNKSEIARLQNELLITQSSLQNLQQKNIQLERTLDKEQLSKHELEVNLDEVRLQTEEKQHTQSDFMAERILAVTKIEKEDIDDLKEIKGIGPVIEKKLNMLGIVSFKQVSEFTDEVIGQISHAVKFFPDRIMRDQWVRQASDLYKLKSSGRLPT
jgi:predicted flap endonuclease-1-like 5' DNA nuclease